MAKRKKIKKTLPLALSAAAIILGIVAIIMLFLPAVAIKDTDKTYTGLQIVFGHSEKLGGSIQIEIFKFSFMNLLTYILVLAGVIFSILGALGKLSKIASFVAAAAFIVAGVFFFLVPSLTIVNESASSVVAFFGGNIKENLVLAVGSIVGAITAIVAGAAQLLKVFIK